MHRPLRHPFLLAAFALTLLSPWVPGPRALAQSAAPSGRPAFPIPRAEKEFEALLPGLQDYCDHITKGDMKAFIVALSSYGPLDLQIRKAASPTEARYLRSFHVGIVSAMSQTPEDLASRLGQPFESAPADIQGRKKRFVQELPQIEAFVRKFQAVPQITLLAHWGFKDELRVNDTFHILGQTNESIPSPVMGFVPSGRWKPYKTMQQYLDTLSVSRSAFDALDRAFGSLSVVSARRTEDGSTEIIGTGIANNTCGLLFTPAGATFPAVGQRLPSGAQYSVLDPLKPGVFYFETS